MRLNLGCGKDIKKGYINLDIIKLNDIDVIHDLDKFPYPFEDNTFDEILCKNILNHLNDLIKVMEELHRIAKPNAIIKIDVSFFSSADFFTDITHKHSFTTRSFQYFEEKNPLNYYSKARFKVIKSKIIFHRLNKFLEPFVNLSTKFKNLYEIYLAQIFPANKIKFELRVIK